MSRRPRKWGKCGFFPYLFDETPKMRGLFWLIAAVLTVGAAQNVLAQGDAPADKKKQLYWIFLTTGKSAAGVTLEELRAKQKAHIDNFNRLAKENVLFAAGPMADPTKVKRGIVLLEAESPDQFPTLFEPDPYVKEGFMKLDANAIVKMVGKTVVDAESEELEELRIAIWDRTESEKELAPAEKAELLEAHEAYWTKQRTDKKIALRCRFADDAPHFGIVIFPKSDDAEIKKLLDADPLVAKGRIQYALMPQYLMKGAVSVE